MRAAVVEGISKPLVVREVPDPKCPPNGVIIRTGANGICRTDWHLWSGDWSWRLEIEPPWVLGHEIAGTIEEVGPEVTGWKKGDRVTYPMTPGEGTCEWCRSGHQHLCDSSVQLVPGVAYWGGFGQFVAVPYADVNLVALPESLKFVDAASMGCRYIAAFHGIVDQVKVSGGEWVVVYGCGGGIGLSAVQIATAMGANVIAVDVFDEKLAAAREVGAVHTINATKDNPVDAVMTFTRGGAQVSIDALGIAETCRNSVMSLRKRGRHLYLGHTTSVEKGDIPLPMDVMLLKELQILSAFGMQAPRFGAMLDMVESGKLEPGKVVHRTGRRVCDNARAARRARDRRPRQDRHAGHGFQPCARGPRRRRGLEFAELQPPAHSRSASAVRGVWRDHRHLTSAV